MYFALFAKMLCHHQQNTVTCAELCAVNTVLIVLSRNTHVIVKIIRFTLSKMKFQAKLKFQTLISYCFSSSCSSNVFARLSKSVKRKWALWRFTILIKNLRTVQIIHADSFPTIATSVVLNFQLTRRIVTFNLAKSKDQR